MKKLVVAVLSGVAINASAAMYQAPVCNAMNLTAACMEGWDAGVDILYLQAQETEFADQTLSDFRGNYGFGVRLEGSYHWGHGHDINLNWQHYSKTTDKNVVIAGDQGNVDVDVALSSKSRFDIVNLEVGHQYGVLDQWQIRVHGGLQYANLKTNSVATTQDGTSIGSVTRKGWGPRIGLGATHNFNEHLSMFAKGAVGLMKAKFSAVVAQDGANLGLDEPSYFFTSLESDMRLGLAYTNQMANGRLTLRGGWQTNYYAGSNEDTNLSWDGFFLGLKWLGNA